MNICICDDDTAVCEHLQSTIYKHGAHRLTIYHSAEELLFECDGSFPFDCIFLDIQMKQMNGMECARKIRKFDKKVNIAFFSVIQDYVFEGYEVNAIRYLLKPLREEQCFDLLDILEAALQKERSYIYLNKTRIDCGRIRYVESIGHYTSIHVEQDGGGEEVLENKISLLELLSQLPECFVQTHRSYVVNLDYVESLIKEGCLLEGGTLIPISRKSLKKVNQAFLDYIKGGLG